MTTTSHYSALAYEFDDFSFAFEDMYKTKLLNDISEALQLRPDDILCDIGGGTGKWGSLLFQHAQLSHPIINVEPSEQMQKVAASKKGIQCFCGDALQFLERAKQDGLEFNKCLLRECIHHFQPVEALFKGLFRVMPHNGVALALTRPQQTEFPFFEAAHQSFKNSTNPHEFILAAESAGFVTEVSQKYAQILRNLCIYFDVARCTYCLEITWWKSARNNGCPY